MRIKKNGKIITLTESDLKRISKRVLNEGIFMGKDKSIKFQCSEGNTLKNNESGKFIPILKLEVDGEYLTFTIDDVASDREKALHSAFCKGKQ